MANTTALDQIWKGKGWSDGEPVTRVLMPDNTYAEGVAALLYAWDGSNWIKQPSSVKTLTSAAISLTATGTVVAAVSSHLIKVYAIKLVCSAALSVNWRSGGSTALEGVQSYAANGGYTESVNPPNFLLATAAGATLDLVISGSGTVAGRVSYWTDDTS